MTEPRTPLASGEARLGRPQTREGRYVGPLRITPAVIVVAAALAGSIIFIGWVVLAIDEDQIPLLASGFAVLGASFVATAIGSFVAMWRAASRVDGGRAVALAVVGGLAGLAAIGCFTITALSALVWTT
ncbi:MAG: hypothetical protein L0221_18345 [Chloroflexi bacterium]|nr:hypothetical protein [Chloroflexota bacterium]